MSNTSTADQVSIPRWEPARCRLTQLQSHGFQSMIVHRPLSASLSTEHPLYNLAQLVEGFEDTLLHSHSVHLRNTRALLGYHDVSGHPMSYPSVGPCYEIATNLLVSYHLIDCVTTYPSIAGLSVPPAPSNVLRPTTWTADTLEHFKGWDAVREWPHTLRQARDLIITAPRPKKPQSVEGSITLKLLHSLSSTHYTKKYYTICGNFEAAALHLSVLREANWDSTSDTGIQAMDEMLLTKDLGLSADDQRLAKFVKNNGKNMRVPLQLALIASPIYLLSTSTLYKKSPVQTALWRLCTSVGNDKPDMLKKVESAIWKALWNISCHGETGVELHELVCSPEWRQWENATDINDGVFFFNPTSMTVSPRGTAFITEMPDSPMAEEFGALTSITSTSESLIEASQPRLLITAPPPPPDTQVITEQSTIQEPATTTPGTESTDKRSRGKEDAGDEDMDVDVDRGPKDMAEDMEGVQKDTDEDTRGGQKDMASTDEDMASGQEKDMHHEDEDEDMDMADGQKMDTAGGNKGQEIDVVDGDAAVSSSPERQEQPAPVDSAGPEVACNQPFAEEFTKFNDLEQDEDNELSDSRQGSDEDKADNDEPAPSEARSDEEENDAQNDIPVSLQNKRETLPRAAKDRPKLPSPKPTGPAPKGKTRTRTKSSAHIVVESDDDDDEIVFIGMERRVRFTRPAVTLDLEEKVQILRSSTQPVVYCATGKGYQLDLIAHDHQSLQTLEEVANMIKGKPKFLTDRENSMIRIMDRQVYNSLGADDLLSILREQHIVKDSDVTSPMKTRSADEFRAALRTLGSMAAMRSVHDLSIVPKNGNLNLRGRLGTLGQIYEASFKGIDKILNVLDIPMEMKGMKDLEVSTDYVALFNTMGDWKTSRAFAAGHSRWGLAATKGARHGWHIDSNGLGTYIETKCGGKLWIMGRPKDPNNSHLDDTSFFLSDYDLDGPNRSLLDVEAILLLPGTELIMRPNTLHMVYTPFDSVCHGGHFYAAGNMVDSLSGIFHAFVAGTVVTNTNHTHTRLHLQQMISMYHRIYVEDSFPHDDPCRDHAPDPDDWVGVMNVFALCIYAMLMNVLDHHTYFPTFRAAASDIPMTLAQRTLWQQDDMYAMTYEERKACMHARGEAMEIMGWFQDHFDVSRGDTVEKMEDFQKKLLAHYCVMLLSYKKAAVEGDHQGPPGCTVDDVRVQLSGVGSGPLNIYLRNHLNRPQDATENLAQYQKAEMSLVPIETQERPARSVDLWRLGQSERDDVYLASMAKIKQEPEGPAPKKRRIQ